MDSTNYTDITRPVFARNCRYPINFTEAKKIHDRTDDSVSVTKAMTDDEETVKLKKVLYSSIS